MLVPVEAGTSEEGGAMRGAMGRPALRTPDASPPTRTGQMTAGMGAASSGPTPGRRPASAPRTGADATAGFAPLVGLDAAARPTFALVGSVWLLWALDYRLSTAVWVGIIALVGLAAQTGIVMIVYIAGSACRERC